MHAVAATAYAKIDGHLCHSTDGIQHERVNQIQQALNCWKSRSLSLIGKVTVIKSLLLPQLLYLFSVLCISIPKSFFKKLNTIFL